MDENEVFYQNLRAMLLRHAGLRWISETDSKLTAVRFPWWRITFWPREPDGVEENRLRNQIAIREGNDPFQRVGDLLLNQKSLISIKKRTKEPAVYDLYILARFGFWYVGIKTTVVET